MWSQRRLNDISEILEAPRRRPWPNSLRIAAVKGYLGVVPVRRRLPSANEENGGASLPPPCCEQRLRKLPFLRTLGSSLCVALVPHPGRACPRRSPCGAGGAAAASPRCRLDGDSRAPGMDGLSHLEPANARLVHVEIVDGRPFKGDLRVQAALTARAAESVGRVRVTRWPAALVSMSRRRRHPSQTHTHLQRQGTISKVGVHIFAYLSYSYALPSHIQVLFLCVHIQ